MIRLLAIVAFLPGLALANSYKETIDDAAESLEDAASTATHKGSPACKGIVAALNREVEDVDSIRTGTIERRLNELLVDVGRTRVDSQRFGCPPKVTERIASAVASMNSARSLLDKDDHRDRRHRHDDDDDDGRERYNPPPNNPPPPSGRAIEASMGDLRIIYGERQGNEQGVRVDVPSATVRNIGRGQFYFAGHVRAENGQWTEWVSGPQMSAPQDPYVWANVYSQFFPARILRSAPGSRFLVRISLFDQNRNELAWKEATIDLAGGQPLPPANAPPPQGVARDCGTGEDPGCGVQRGRGWAMDRVTFEGFVSSLRGNSSDLAKGDMCKSVLASNYLTAKQLGIVMDQFNSDLVRLDVAKFAAPHVTDAMHAIGLSSKFRSALLANDFTKVMAAQQVVH